jgi:hypothetical protein
MVAKIRITSDAVLDRMVAIVWALPWLEILAEVWKVGFKLWNGMAHEGMYEVLEHAVTLELQDKNGRRALVRKRQRVRYLQNNIIAYQDQAWGDGEILVNYRCSPGKVVDLYRPGQKTFLLISLRETKHRGDVDEFNIRWRMRNGFLRETELWGTEVNHKTKQLRIRVIFPRSRPPRRVWVIESLRRRKRRLGEKSQTRLRDGRWLVVWETQKPRLNEQYQLQWEW